MVRPGLWACFLWLPLFLQEAVGLPALASGLTTFPEAIGVVLFTQVAARLYPRIGPRRLTAAGLTMAATAMSLLCLVGLTTNLWIVRGLMFFIGGGMSFLFLSTKAAAFATITPAATGRAAALFNVQNQLGSALGVAVLSSVLAALGMVQIGTNGIAQPNLQAYHSAFLAASALALTGAMIALAISDRAAAVTMRRR